MQTIVQMSTKKQIHSVQRRRTILLQKIIDTRYMVKGTFRQVYRRCGKPSCWCVDDNGHLSNRISWSENAKSKTKAIPSDDLPWIQNMTANYKAFRKARQSIRALSDELNRLLDQLENEILDRTKSQRKYLWYGISKFNRDLGVWKSPETPFSFPRKVRYYIDYSQNTLPS